jgi:serine/threonine protein kinase
VIVPECPSCGKQLEGTAEFCPDDGTPVGNTTAGASAPQPSSGEEEPRDGARPVSGIELPIVLGNRYRLESSLGGGGMAKVYRATDLTLERQVAVKVMNPDLRKEPDFDARFQREARIASQLASPYIVVTHDYGLDPTYGPYLVMEYLKGHSLRESLLANGPLPARAGLQLGAQLLLALIHAHEKQIVHRDLKPDNVMILNQSGIGMQIRVLDFGIARLIHRPDSDHAETLTQVGSVLGTPRYMSPEQLAGRTLDWRSDLYSAALVIYEGLTGTLPFAAKKKLCETCPELPSATEDLFNACLEANPADRPASALVVYRRLQEICSASGLLSLGSIDTSLPGNETDRNAPTLAYPQKKIGRRVLLGGAAAALVGLSIWGVFAFFLSSPTEPAVKETVLGFSVGDSRDDLVARLGKPQRSKAGDPWRKEPKALGLVLRPEDLAGDRERDNCETLIWSKGRIGAVFHDNLVRALVVGPDQKAETGRGLRLGDHEIKLEHLYPEKPDIGTADASATTGHGFRKSATWVKIYRYNKLGIGFEVQDEKVVSMTIFPPQAE